MATPPPPYSFAEASNISSVFPVNFPVNEGPVENGSLGVWLSTDPRSSSTQSLAPSVPDSSAGSNLDERRTLLVVYLHGFYGNDQSFQSFPAHVHNFLRDALFDSHVIHTKIYPRYKTYRAIDIARDKLSAWLEPHEAPTTDVIIIGHSMGGLLAADIVLMPNRSPYQGYPFKHRIIGTISLDSPFLSLHPGLIVSGISSLFQPASKSLDHEIDVSADTNPSPLGSPSNTSIDSSLQTLSISSPGSTVSNPQSSDPYFDPPFFNDEPFREQPFVKRLLNFAAKHKSEGILGAVGSHIASHLEYGGCLADYQGLMWRYNQIRALEDADDLQALNREQNPPGNRARVRFVNYYTLSSGRPKASKSPSTERFLQSQRDISIATQEDLCSTTSQNLDLFPSQVESLDDKSLRSGFNSPVPHISVENFSGSPLPQDSDPASRREKSEERDTVQISNPEPEPEPHTYHGDSSMQELEPTPMAEDLVDDDTNATEGANGNPLIPTYSDLEPVPDPPSKPKLPDLEQCTDKETLKQAEKESKRLQKAYDQAIKDHAKTLREREKLVEKRQKNAKRDADKLAKEEQKVQRRLEKEEQKQQKLEEAAARQVAEDSQRITAEATSADPEATKEKPKKLRKFCNLPHKINGVRDPTWVDVYMDGVDEVGAHCGLFFPGAHYEKLVGDVGGRIMNWVQADLSKRAIMEMQE